MTEVQGDSNSNKPSEHLDSGTSQKLENSSLPSKIQKKPGFKKQIAGRIASTVIADPRALR